jgi:hypothetical protein
VQSLFPKIFHKNLEVWLQLVAEKHHRWWYRDNPKLWDVRLSYAPPSAYQAPKIAVREIHDPPLDMAT